MSGQTQMVDLGGWKIALIEGNWQNEIYFFFPKPTKFSKSADEQLTETGLERS